jgi:mannose/cellobiose epimerase-like protein (N-acyl-D-glucosamine 2-epimerase family)
MKNFTATHRKPTDRSTWCCSVCIAASDHMDWRDAVKAGWSYFTTVKTDYSLCPTCSGHLIKLEGSREA